MLGTLAFQYAALRAPAFGVPGASANLFWLIVLMAKKKMFKAKDILQVKYTCKHKSVYK